MLLSSYKNPFEKVLNLKINECFCIRMSSKQKKIGKISEIFDEKEFDWIIDVSSDEVLERDGYFESPEFSFSSFSWCLRMYPKGDGPDFSQHMSLYLRSNCLHSEKEVSFSLCMTVGEDKRTQNGEASHCFKRSQIDWGWRGFILRKTVLNRLSKVKKNCRQLTIKVIMKCPPHNEDTLLMERLKGKETLFQNYKDLLLHGEDHDLVIQVKDMKFKAHRNIMQCRCPVFKSMLSHEMLEKNSGVVVIPDCDPLAFEQFLIYVYMGKLEVLDKSTVLGLYFIADKYNMDSLKGECSAFIKKSLSADLICDVIQLALNHSDSVLLEFATKYFVDNAKEIFPTVEWQSFMKEYPTQANELIIKAFGKLSKKEDSDDANSNDR